MDSNVFTPEYYVFTNVCKANKIDLNLHRNIRICFRGGQSPLFSYSINMANVKEQILEIANKHLSDESHFIVDVVISAKKGPNKVLVLLDGDEGVNIDDCADLSRAVSHEIEEKGIIDDAYRLEVSSPGVDFPLTMDRQYKKNIGRVVKASLHDGQTIKGELKSYDDKSLTIETAKGKGKKKETEAVEIPLLNIKKTIVQISFK